MATRRDSREWAVQILFQLDLNPTHELDAVFEAFWQGKQCGKKSCQYTEWIVREVRAHAAEIDACIAGVAENWDVKRMGVLDRNVLRVAVCEMLYGTEVPPVVSINEAVDIAKYFSSAESGRFVNGILDRVRKGLKRPSRTAGTDPAREAGKPE